MPPINKTTLHKLMEEASVNRTMGGERLAPLQKSCFDHIEHSIVGSTSGKIVVTLLEEIPRRLAIDHLAIERPIAGDNLAHLRFDLRQILRRERLVAGEVVIKPIIDDGPDGDLRAGIKRLHFMATLISNVLYRNSAVDHQTLATYIHRIIEADHPPPQMESGQLPPELSFGRNLIGFDEVQRERLEVATAQAALSKLGYEVGKIDGILGRKTTAAIRAFQKSRNRMCKFAQRCQHREKV